MDTENLLTDCLVYKNGFRDNCRKSVAPQISKSETRRIVVSTPNLLYAKPAEQAKPSSRLTTLKAGFKTVECQRRTQAAIQALGCRGAKRLASGRWRNV